MQRTYVFTVGTALVYNKTDKKMEEVNFKIEYSTLNNTEEKIIRKVEKALNRRITELGDYKHIAELRIMPDDKFYEESTLSKTEEYIPTVKED